ADVIMFIYREEAYNKQVDQSKMRLAELVVAKQRNGPTGTVNLTFLEEFTRFENRSTVVETS
ncbi:MAG: replicative DNA helicase, partial [Deltaproteobacteria bacterium]|nr:replicative DNA helicase [Deltaproteobacteria bacterium]